MTIEQAAEVLGISRVTAHRYWTFARAWLHQQMAGASPGRHFEENDPWGGARCLRPSH
jgi:hypothetical protein